MDRRQFLGHGSIALLANGGILGSSLPSLATTVPVIRDTRQGPVRGEAAGASLRFLGVPYAAPPIGPLRFHATHPAPARTGVLDTTAFAPAPIQKDAPPGLYGPGAFPRSEDCLYLNVWTPTTLGPHPV